MQIANWETMPTKSKAELGPQKQCRSLRFKCNGLLHLNRGLPESTVYDLSTVRRPEVRGEISPRIKCRSLRFKCNRLLYLNRGLPGSAVYDLSTDRQMRPMLGRKVITKTCLFPIRVVSLSVNLSKTSPHVTVGGNRLARSAEIDSATKMHPAARTGRRG